MRKADDFINNIKIQAAISVIILLLWLIGTTIMRLGDNTKDTTAFVNRKPAQILRNRPDVKYRPRYIPSEKQLSEEPKIYKPEVSADIAGISDDNVKDQLSKVRYNGYMQIGSKKLALINENGEKKTASEGDTIEENLKIEMIHESFLAVNSNGRSAGTIPFTQDRGKDVTNITASSLSAKEKKPSPKPAASVARDQVYPNKQNRANQNQPPTPPQLPVEDAPPAPW